MNITEALEKLESYQAQIVHGPTVFKDIADAVRSQSATLETTKEMLKCEQTNIKNLNDWVRGVNGNPTLSGRHYDTKEWVEARLVGLENLNASLRRTLENLLAIKAAKDAQGTSTAYIAAKNMAWKVAEELVGKQPIRADLDAPRPVKAGPACDLCGKPATCHGQYEGHPEGYACNECCGHMNEDGHCEPIKEENAALSRPESL